MKYNHFKFDGDSASELANEAIKTLRKLQDPNHEPHIRYTAAVEILEWLSGNNWDGSGK